MTRLDLDIDVFYDGRKVQPFPQQQTFWCSQVVSAVDAGVTTSYLDPLRAIIPAGVTKYINVLYLHADATCFVAVYNAAHDAPFTLNAGMPVLLTNVNIPHTSVAPAVQIKANSGSTTFTYVIGIR